MTVYVYGASDDLIEIDGSLREEFGAYDSDPNYVAFSDGTLLKISYDGDWNIKLIEGQADIITAGNITVAAQDSELATLTDLGVPDYSDLAIIRNDVTYAVVGTNVVK